MGLAGLLSKADSLFQGHPLVHNQYEHACSTDLSEYTMLRHISCALNVGSSCAACYSQDVLNILIQHNLIR